MRASRTSIPRDELSVPAQERIGGDDRGDIAQLPTAQTMRPHGQPARVDIGQLQASTPQLPTQDTILCNETAEYFSLLAIQPPGEDGEKQLQRRGVHHGGNLYHGLDFMPLFVHGFNLGNYALKRKEL